MMDRVRELRDRGRTPKEIARALKVSPATVAPLIRALGAADGRVREAQLIGCWANAGWSSSVTVAEHADWQDLDRRDRGDRGETEPGASGLVSLAVARERGSSVLACGYLVDTWCLGVKNAMGPKSMERRKLPAFLNGFFSAYEGPPVEVTLSLARQVVFGAVDYARRLGFEPHEDFARAAGHLGDWDGKCGLGFGRDGMPVYVEGPHDDAGSIMRTLRKNVGDGNFHYVAGLK